MNSKCHSMYLKWTYYGCNFALGKLPSKYIINSIVSSFIVRFVSMSASQHAHRFFHLRVHVRFYLHFWGCNVPSNSSFGGTKKINCIFFAQGRAPCCFFVSIMQLAKTFFLSDIGSDRKWGSI